jgi:hypothetical protein
MGRMTGAAKFFWPAVGAILAALAVVQVSSIRQESQTNDEAAHLVAGYSYWKTGDFRLNPEHPPLSKLLAALPLLALKPDLKLLPQSWNSADEYALGKEFLYRNRIDADTLLLAGRSVTILFTLIFGGVLALWARSRFGAEAAVFSLTLFAFDPNIIAHGRYVTSDLLVAFFIFASSISFQSYLEKPARSAALRTGLLTGLALATKHSALLLFPIFLGQMIAHCAVETGLRPVAGKRREACLQALALVVVPFLVVYCLYMFDTRSVLADPVIGSRLHTGGIAAKIPIPAYYYFRGLQLLYRLNRGGHLTYLLGDVGSHGSWLYFPVAFLVKTPVATLLLMASTLWQRRERLSHAVPPAIFFLGSLASSVNLGIRHILPIYPFLFILVNRARWRWVLAAVLIAESLSVYPHYLAFFNRAVGGSSNGPRYLLDSNLDWGQDLKKLRAWRDRRPESSLALSYFGEADPHYYGVSYRQWLVSTRDEKEIAAYDCYAAISVEHLYGLKDQRFRALQRHQPIARIGYSIYVYDLRHSIAGRSPRLVPLLQLQRDRADVNAQLHTDLHRQLAVVVRQPDVKVTAPAIQNVIKEKSLIFDGLVSAGRDL